MSKFRFRDRSRRHEARALPERVPIRSIVPNLITATAAAAGIVSIAFSSGGCWEKALVALLVACVCDGIDGRVARLMKASSKLGAELDSLADFVNFGVAPAMFMYFFTTGKFFGATADAIADLRTSRLVLGAAVFYALCDCFRLARFNTMLEQPTLPYWKHYFLGVPAPGGCWMVLSPAILSLELDAKGKAPAFSEFFQNPIFGVFMLVFVGLLMASRVPTISLKALHIKKSAMPLTLAGLLFMVAFLISNLWLALGSLGILYIVTVPVSAVLFMRGRGRYLRSAGAGAGRMN